MPNAEYKEKWKDSKIFNSGMPHTEADLFLESKLKDIEEDLQAIKDWLKIEVVEENEKSN